MEPSCFPFTNKTLGLHSLVPAKGPPKQCAVGHVKPRLRCSNVEILQRGGHVDGVEVMWWFVGTGCLQVVMGGLQTNGGGRGRKCGCDEAIHVDIWSRNQSQRSS